MASTDAPATLAELQTDFLEKLKEVTGVTAVNTITTRFLNQALQEIHQERWWWAERHSTIRTIPPYTTGSVDIAITSLTTRRAVTGVSTLWATANSFTDANAVAGYKMTLANDNAVHRIQTVTNDTSITLDTSTPYLGEDALDDAGYAIYQDEYALASDFDHRLLDTRFFDEECSIELLGAQEFYRLYPKNATRQRPRHATLIALGPSSTVDIRRRILFGPAPDASYVIPYRYYTTNLAVSSTGTGAANLSATTDQPIVPMLYRSLLTWKALEMWASTRTKLAEAVVIFKTAYQEILARARASTSQADDRPRLVPQVQSYRQGARRPYRKGGVGRFEQAGWDQMGWR